LLLRGTANDSIALYRYQCAAGHISLTSVRLIAKRRAYGRGGLATSAILKLAPKKNQQNYNWQRYAQQPKQCTTSQSHCFSPLSLMLSVTMFAAGERPCWILSSLGAKKFLRMIPRGPQAQCAKIEPGQPDLRAAQRGVLAADIGRISAACCRAAQPCARSPCVHSS
jgi:hypothetical protein